MNGRRIYHARGKVLGGSSSINGMIFKRMETCLAPDDGPEYRGDDGPLVLERGPATNPLFQVFLDATFEAGHPRTTDVNGQGQEGFNAFDRSVHRGRRRRNLQYHLEVYVQYACKQPVSMQPMLAMRRRPFVGLQWLARREPGATNHFEAGGFIRSNEDVAYPKLMFHFLPIAIRYDGSAASKDHDCQVHVGPIYSDTRGSVRIKSADPRGKPALRFNCLSIDQDRQEWVEAVRNARRLLSQPAMPEFNDGETSLGPSVETDQEILD